MSNTVGTSINWGTVAASNQSSFLVGGSILGITNNVERFRINPGGDVGIGTTSPASLLHANGTYTQTHPSIAGIFSIQHSANNTISFYNSGIGEFLRAGPTNTVSVLGQELHSTQRGAYFGNALGGNALTTTANVQFQSLANDYAVTKILGTDATGNVRWRDAATISGGGSSQWTTSASNIDYSTGNVGIGTINITDANYKLFVEQRWYQNTKSKSRSEHLAP